MAFCLCAHDPSVIPENAAKKCCSGTYITGTTSTKVGPEGEMGIL
jgi:hypothetical protein